MRYSSVFMKYRRTEEEERVVAFAGELLAEAHRRGILLRLEALLGDDELRALVLAGFTEPRRGPGPRGSR